ncbi:MAG: hypothetical protein PHU04_03710 [Candidatus Peribacteraceae bacterium]|nr:hypothetical protein [Candidatus Peribacteraceae bacterium]
METPDIPEELRTFLPADAERIAFLIRRFGWNLRDFLASTPNLQERLEGYNPRYYAEPQFPNMQREEIIDAAIVLYKEKNQLES